MTKLGGKNYKPPFRFVLSGGSYQCGKLLAVFEKTERNTNAPGENGISNFGSTEVQFSLYDKDKKKYKISVLLLIDNNGKRPDQNNYKLEWHENYVKISVIHYNGAHNSVRSYFDDL